MKPILFVRCDAVDTFGLSRRTRSDRAAPRSQVWDSMDPDASRPDLADVDGVVLFGSTYNVEHAEEQPFIKEVRELTLEAMDREIPFLGVCFGAQVLAWSLDAEVGKAPNREVGFEPMRPDPAAAADPLLGHYRDGDMVFQWHMDTFEPPAGSHDARDRRPGAQPGVPHRRAHVGRAVALRDRPARARVLAGHVQPRGRPGSPSGGSRPDDVRAEADAYLDTHEQKGRELFARFVGVVQETAR